MSRMLVNFKRVSIALHDTPLFNNLLFTLGRGKVLALVGPNGCGKSTILRLILHEHSKCHEPFGWPDFRITGENFIQPGISIGLLPQMLRGNEPFVFGSGSTDPRVARTMAVLCRDFSVTDIDKPVQDLSDGELQKRAIISLLLSDHDLYLFDEPTNYLDIAGITAFEQHVFHLKKRSKGVLLITHDRALTDELADRTILLTAHGIFKADGGATHAWSVRTSDFESRRRKSKSIHARITKLQDDVRARAGWAAAKEKSKKGARGAKGHISRLSAKMAKRAKAVQARAEREIEKLDATKPFIPKVLNLKFPEYEIRRRVVFSLRDTWFRYDAGPPHANAKRRGFILSGIDISATTRDKVCLMGANGSGKTTLIRLILGDLSPSRGDCRLTGGVGIAHVPQGLAGFYQKARLLDNFDNCGCDETTIRQHLGAALLRKEKVCERVENLSYGELMRAAIVRCILEKAEFLLLDEPTSHLDIESIEVLEQLLHDFQGGFLMISHDRAFVANVADKLCLLDGGRLKLV